MAWTFGAFRLDPDRFELLRGGQQILLEPHVLTLLILLIRHRDRLVSKDEIAQALWQRGEVSDASIARCIHAARKAVGDDGDQQQVIRTIHGRGVRFVAPVEMSQPLAILETPLADDRCQPPRRGLP